jgi:hypothetical protein
MSFVRENRFRESFEALLVEALKEEGSRLTDELLTGRTRRRKCRIRDHLQVNQ